MDETRLKIWTLRGYGNLQHLSGEYKEKEAALVVQRAMSESNNLFEFDQCLEGKTSGTNLLSGSQLLHALHAGPLQEKLLP